ncbi:MAG: hypothetical protein KTV45_12445 [Acidimicrobiia bacterium]|nr:hypothetical protein [Acidimicrobiia bacterium]
MRPGPRKVEQFYFLATGWLSWAFAAISTTEGERRVTAWFGGEDWRDLIGMDLMERLEVFQDKFKNELGYQYVQWWPIYRREDGKGRVMYHMIHASDHDAAPKQMHRAYRKIVNSPEPMNEPQLDIE